MSTVCLRYWHIFERRLTIFVKKTVTKLMHSQQRASNPYSFMKIPLYWQPPIFKFCLHPAPCLSSPKSLPPLFTLFFALFIWLNGWSFHIWCVILFNDAMDLHMLILGTLVPEEPCCVFYTTRHQIYWGLIYNEIFCKYSVLISHIQTKTCSTNKGQKHHLLCAHSSYLYFIE